jgi:ATP-dependent DNA helicase RecG
VKPEWPATTLHDSPSAQVEASRYLKKWSQPDGFLEKNSVGNVYYILRKSV